MKYTFSFLIITFIPCISKCFSRKHILSSQPPSKRPHLKMTRNALSPDTKVPKYLPLHATKPSFDFFHILDPDEDFTNIDEDLKERNRENIQNFNTIHEIERKYGINFNDHHKTLVNFIRQKIVQYFYKPQKCSPSPPIPDTSLIKKMCFYSGNIYKFTRNNTIDTKYNEHENFKTIVCNDKTLNDIVITCRGTSNIYDWKDNLYCVPTTSNLFKGKIHIGYLCAFEQFLFSNAYAELYLQLKQYDQNILKRPTVYLNGHSSGGAKMVLLALYFSKLFPNIQFQVFTFGAPLFCDTECIQNIKETENLIVYCFELKNDIIPFLGIGNKLPSYLIENDFNYENPVKINPLKFKFEIQFNMLFQKIIEMHSAEMYSKFIDPRSVHSINDCQ